MTLALDRGLALLERLCGQPEGMPLTVLERHIAIRRIALPFTVPVLDVQQFWHRRMQHDLANRWLRGVFFEVNRREANEGLPG